MNVTGADFDRIIKYAIANRGIYALLGNPKNGKRVARIKNCFLHERERPTVSITQDERKIKQKAKNIYTAVYKGIAKEIRKNKYNITEVPERHKSTVIDRDKFREYADGETFYCVDINHCYWRIAHNMGIINKKVYDEYKDKPEYKIYRNAALSTASSCKEYIYYKGNKEFHRIKEYKPCEEMIYKNIRNTAFNDVGDIFHKYMKNCVGYRIDCIFCDEKVAKKIKKEFEKRNYDVHIQEIVKADDNNILKVAENKIVRF